MLGDFAHPEDVEISAAVLICGLTLLLLGLLALVRWLAKT